MATHKLTHEQRATLCGWLAADYDSALIAVWFVERQWPPLTRQAIHHYREKLRPEITALRTARHDTALNTGLALKAERVARLVHHADALEAIKWETDDKGRCWNEKAWRETLDDIAKEVGGRVQRHEQAGPGGGPIQVIQAAINLRALSDSELDTLEELRRKMEPAP